MEPRDTASLPTLVTGGRGFFGSHLVRAFAQDQVVAPGRDDLDLLDFEAVREALGRRPLGRVIHAAGYVGGLGLNRDHPGRMATANLRMGLNLLEAAAEHGVPVCIVSTVCVYPEDAPIPTPEHAIYDGYPAPATAFYGLAKRELLSLADGLNREFGLPFWYVIPTNLYGPGDHFDDARSHVIPALIKRALRARDEGARELVVWGSPDHTRDFLHVRDAAAAIRAIVDWTGPDPIFNLGSGVETSIGELVGVISDVVGFDGDIVWDDSHGGGAPRRALDATRLQREVGVTPRVTLREGIEETVSWYERTAK